MTEEKTGMKDTEFSVRNTSRCLLRSQSTLRLATAVPSTPLNLQTADPNNAIFIFM